MSTRYDSGRAFEHRIRKHLRTNGYGVDRGAGSKGDSKGDLWAFKPGQLLLIQAKRNGSISTPEWNRLFEVAQWIGAVPLVALCGPRGRGIEYRQICGQRVTGARGIHVPFVVDQIAEVSR